MPFYAVARGRKPGIFKSWKGCEAQIKCFPGAKFKKFDTVEAAQTFIQTEGGGTAKAKCTSKAKPSYSRPNISNDNLKRSLVTTAENHKKNDGESLSSNKKPKPLRKRSDTESGNDTNDNFSDESSIHINTMLNKQMADKEKIVDNFEKGVDEAILIEPLQPKRRSSTNMEFKKDADGYVEVFTDGAWSCYDRQGPKAGYGVYWGDDHTLNTSEPVSGRATNNCGHIQAAICAIRQAIEHGIKQLAIYTESQFLINSTKLKSGEPVKNEAGFKELEGLQTIIAIKWNYVDAHKFVIGIKIADEFAKAGAAKYKKPCLLPNFC